MSTNSEYNNKLREKQIEKLRRLEKTLPTYVKPYLKHKELNNQINTVVSYAYDLNMFFLFLKERNPLCKALETKDIPENILNNLTFDDIEEYQEYLMLNKKENESKRSNREAGVARRMASLRGFFKFSCQKRYLKQDPTAGIETKKIPEKEIIRMNPEEVRSLLDTIVTSSVNSNRQRMFCQKTMLRDTAILTLLLHTGIRVSECVGIDVNDINFKENSFVVLRKGGKSATLYFSENLADTLQDYIENERPRLLNNEEDDALFISLRHQRMSIRSVQVMVKKFTEIAVPGKKLSPHKMRSTYGTALYKQTGDIRLVADVLGHNDINTTAKHYAAMDDEHRRQAANINPYE